MGAIITIIDCWSPTPRGCGDGRRKKGDSLGTGRPGCAQPRRWAAGLMGIGLGVGLAGGLADGLADGDGAAAPGAGGGTGVCDTSAAGAVSTSTIGVGGGSSSIVVEPLARRGLSSITRLLRLTGSERPDKRRSCSSSLLAAAARRSRD